jgi:crossover junction endodeoxyribonuclease RuvC
MKTKIILGIDPGFGRTGFGVIECDGQKLKCLEYGVIETDKGDEFVRRLKDISEELKKIIKKYTPNVIAVEDLFFYRNVTTAIKVAQARGVVLLTAVDANIAVLEYTPLQVKQAVCGYGKADKGQVTRMVKTILSLEKNPTPDDAADALAVGIAASSARGGNIQVSNCK